MEVNSRMRVKQLAVRGMLPIGMMLWGFAVSQHDLALLGPQNHLIIDFTRRIVYDPGQGGWIEMNTLVLKPPAQGWERVAIPAAGLLSGVLTGLAVTYLLVHRRRVGLGLSAIRRRPAKMAFKLVPTYGVLLGCYSFGAIYSGVVYQVFDSARVRARMYYGAPDLQFLFVDREEALYGLVIACLLLLPVILLAPWTLDRLPTRFGIWWHIYEVQRAWSVDWRAGTYTLRSDPWPAAERTLARIDAVRASPYRDMVTWGWAARADLLLLKVRLRGDESALAELMSDVDEAYADFIDSDTTIARWGRGGKLALAYFRDAFGRALFARYELSGSIVALDNAITALSALRSRSPFSWRLARSTWRIVPAHRYESDLALAAALAARSEISLDEKDLAEALRIARKIHRVAPRQAAEVLGELELLRCERGGMGSDEALRSAFEILNPLGMSPLLAKAVLLNHKMHGTEASARACSNAVRWLVDRSAAAGGWSADTAMTAAEIQLTTGGDPAPSYELLRAASHDGALPVRGRVAAASRWGELAADRGEWNEATAGFSAALELLPQLAWTGLAHDEQYAQVAQRTGLAADAAACALAAGHVKQAVELLEDGRLVMWTHLSRQRGLAGIRQEHPELAHRLERLRLELDASYLPRAAPGVEDAYLRRGAERRIALGKQWNELAGKAPALTASARFDDLREAAAKGPVVVVNASRYRCDAIIVTQLRDPVVVPLHRVTRREVDAWARELAGPTRMMSAPSIVRRIREDLGAELAPALLALLGSDRRVWWCPIGPMSALPLHAALTSDDAASADNDSSSRHSRILSSYTPSMRALVSARSSSQRHADARALVVAIQDSPFQRGRGQRPLPQVCDETRHVARLFADSVELIDEMATVEAVRDALAGCTWAHFACHGDGSGLVMYDGVLTPPALAQAAAHSGAFCCLLACETATPDPKVSDEAVNPAMVIHISGFKHVIGSLWPIDSRDATAVAAALYEAMAVDGTLDADRTAEALDHAVETLKKRRAKEEEIGYWTQLVHIGP
jgi:hypothetical protein